MCPPPVHLYTINREGSSGSIEEKLALELTEQLFNETKGRVYLHKKLSDDDSTMWALLQYPDHNKMGKLAPFIPELDFLADPLHKIKVMTKPFFKMVTNTRDPHQCKMIDALCIKKILKVFHL